jgi:hypothetical protein
MKHNWKNALLVVLLILMLAGCSGSKVSVKVKSAEIVKKFEVDPKMLFYPVSSNLRIFGTDTGGLAIAFSDYDIIRIVLDAKFTNFSGPKESDSDKQKQEVLEMLMSSATFSIGEKTEKVIYALNPEITTATSASDATLFYLIPKGTPLADLKLTFDGTKLGDPSYSLTFKDFK